MRTRTRILTAVVVAGFLAVGLWLSLTGDDGARDSTRDDHELGDAGAGGGRGSNASPGLRGSGSPDMAGHPDTASEGDGAQSPGAPTSKPSALVAPGPGYDVLEAMGARAKSPPGVLEGFVFEKTEPFSDGEAVVWKPGRSAGPESIPAGREPLRSATIARDGSYRFDGLEPGFYYLGVRLRGQPLRLVLRRMEVGEKESAKALTVLGTAIVFGNVYDDAGRPAVDVSVRLSLQSVGPLKNWGTMLQTRTDGDGAYRFEQLPAGGGWLTVSYSNNFDDGKSTRSRSVAVKPGEHLREDFGDEHGVPLVTGRIVTACGEPMRGPGRLILSDKVSKQYLDLRYDEEGRFSHRMPPAAYAAHVWFPDWNRHPHAAPAIDLVVTDRNQGPTLTIPGARIRGRVRSTKGAGGFQARRVAWRRTDRPSNHVSVAIAEDGSYVIDGLAPGTYALSAAPWENDEGIEPVRITIREGQTLIEQDLVALPR